MIYSQTAPLKPLFEEVKIWIENKRHSYLTNTLENKWFPVIVPGKNKKYINLM